MTKKNKILILLFGIILFVVEACQKDYNYVLPPVQKVLPKVSVQTTTLEAAFTNTPPNTTNAAFWKTANYINITSANMSTNFLYGDGLLNMTGTYKGLTDFSRGGDPKLTIKAAYDNTNIYILAEWYDSTVNTSQSSWLYGGDYDNLKPSESSTAWTSQRNSDKLALAFEIANASSPSGNFSNVGCQACCHVNGGNTVMTPTSGTVDIWNWNLATSSPLGYMHDMVSSSSGFVNDAGTSLATRNNSGVTDRSGPAYEWDGTDQTITIGGKSVLLDPAFYLLNKTPMIGNASNGRSVFSSQGCGTCHGDVGEGGSGGGPINTMTENKKSRTAFKAAMDNVPDMSDYWGTLSATDQDDVVTYLRGLSGVPGYYLNSSASGSTTDINAVANVTPTQLSNAMFVSTNHHTKYQVLITRKLKTNNADDIQFDLTANKVYTFGVALMDNDGKNHIGSAKEVLTFK
jgi:mono/diheme cytochrome c family protein